MASATLETRTISELTIDDERSFRHVALYADLKEILRRDAYPFRVMAEPRWDRALLLNLTFWGGNGGDVIVDEPLPADVVAHVAWHHLAARAFPPDARGVTADALFFGESVASAFDVYLVGRLLGHAPRSSFLETQVPAMAEAASAAGLSEEEFAALLQGVATDPDQAFRDLRELLWGATTALVTCSDADGALGVLAGLEGHRFAPLLQRYELSNWILYARAYARPALDPRVRDADRALREESGGLDWLTRTWVAPALRRADE